MTMTKLGPWGGIVALSLFAFHNTAAGQNGPPTANVNVVGGTVTARQGGEWTVNVASDTRVYTETVIAECSFLNSCEARFTAVPEGSLLHVTSIMGFASTQQNAAFVALHNDAVGGFGVLFAAPVPITAGAYYGGLLTFNIPTDVVFTAGQRPILEIGNAAGIYDDGAVRFSITGTLSPAPQ